MNLKRDSVHLTQYIWGNYNNTTRSSKTGIWIWYAAVTKRKAPKRRRRAAWPKKYQEILIVDDEPDSCLIYQIVLQDASYECKSYTD